MRIEFVDRSGKMTPANQQHAERSLLFALSRFSDSIEAVTITTAANGSKVGVAMRCLAKFKLRGRGTVEMTHHSTNIGNGLSHLARQLGRVVSRRLDVRRGLTRESIRLPTN